MGILPLSDHPLIREDSYADKVLKNVEDICRVHNKDMRLVWILLFLRGDYAKNAALKYYAIREQVMGGCTSPYFLFRGISAA